MNLEVREYAKNATRPTPILFVHGAWHGAWCWENFLPYFFDRGYASHAVSLRGHGQSDGQDKIRSHSAAKGYVADVAAVVKALPTPPILVGHSMGGYVVQKYLEQNAAPAAVLLASIPVSGILGFGIRYCMRHPLVFLKAHFTLDLLELVGTPELARDALFSDLTEADLRRYVPQLQSESFRMELETMLLSLPNPKKVLAHDTPILVLAGEKDRVFSTKEQRDTARAYGVERDMNIFPGMAHDMMLEPNWQQVAEYILAWLAKQGL
jgi:pimeloyl-ACP methyl ester carboxylesterase